MSFSEKIKKIRQEALLSQQEFGEAVGVAFSTVNRWENGKSIPDYKSLRAIQQFCDARSISFSLFEEIMKGDTL